MTNEERKLADAVHQHVVLSAGASPAYRFNTIYHEGPDAELRVLIDQQAARIETLTAERDAAVAALQGVRDRLDGMIAEQQAEGERRATAAIVGWLRGRHYWNVSRMLSRRWWQGRLRFANIVAAKMFWEAADAIERGEHITEAKP